MYIFVMKNDFAKLFSAILAFIICAGCIEENVNKNIADTDFNASWLFMEADDNNVADIESSLVRGESVIGMRTVRLPHSVPNESGTCFYMKKFTVGGRMNGKMTYLFFEGASEIAEVWINGVKSVTSSPDGLSFSAHFKAASGENCVVVKLRYTSSGGGLWRNVRLCAKDSLSITECAGKTGGIFIRTSNVKDNSASLNVNVNVRNAYCQDKDVKVICNIIDHNRKRIGKIQVAKTLKSGTAEDFSGSADFSEITLWDTDNPWLYTLQTLIVSDGEILDLKETDFGFREIKAAAGGVEINGIKRVLRGVSHHQKYPYTGYAIPDEGQRRDAYKIKNAGFDYVKVSGPPPAEAFLKACDKYGILLSPEGASGSRNHACFPDGITVNCGVKMTDSDTDWSGLMTMNRLPKHSYYLYKAQRDIDPSELKAFSDPFCYIVPQQFSGKNGGITVYSNCAEVELSADGLPPVRQKPQSGTNFEHPPFYFETGGKSNGTIRVVGYDTDDRPVSECTVKTPLSPMRLRLVFDESGTLISKNDVIFVHCYIFDKNGTVVSTADNEVEFSISGTAALLSPHKTKASSGVATALIRTGNSNNDFTISAKCGLMYTVADR